MKTIDILCMALIGASILTLAGSQSSAQQASSVVPRSTGLGATPTTSASNFFNPEPKPIHTYRDVLAALPSELSHNIGKMTDVQHAAINDILKQKFIDKPTSLDMYVKIDAIANWGGWTLYSDIPNQEGYKVRVFAHFSDDWKAKLATYKQGDQVRINGVFDEVTCKDVWNAFSLVLSAQKCTIIK